VKGHLQHPCRPPDPANTQKWLAARFDDAATHAAVDVMAYLVQLGASVHGHFSDDEDRFSSPISLAALKGHESTVKWLLSMGAALDHSLHAAVAHGSLSIVHLLLEHGALHDHGTVQRALVEAVETENEACFRLLMAHGARLEDVTLDRAMEIAQREQLVSMAALLQENQCCLLRSCSVSILGC
jgi:ankyrin repeat protein